MEDEYIVEDILAVHVENDEAGFLVKWEGYPTTNADPLEPADHFSKTSNPYKPIQKFTQFLNRNIVSIQGEENGKYRVEWVGKDATSLHEMKHLVKTAAWATFKREQKGPSTRSPKRRKVADVTFCDYCGNPGIDICQACKQIDLPPIHFYNGDIGEQDEKKWVGAATYTREHLPADTYCGIHALLHPFKSISTSLSAHASTPGAVIDNLLNYAKWATTNYTLANANGTSLQLPKAAYERQVALLSLTKRGFERGDALDESNYITDETFQLCADFTKSCLAVWVNNLDDHQNHLWLVFHPGGSGFPQLSMNPDGSTICDKREIVFFENIRTFRGQHLHWNLLKTGTFEEDEALWLKSTHFDTGTPQENVQTRDRVMNWAGQLGDQTSFVLSTDSLFDLIFKGNTNNPYSRGPLFNPDNQVLTQGGKSSQFNFTKRQVHLLDVKINGAVLIAPVLVNLLNANWVYITALFHYVYHIYTRNDIVTQRMIRTHDARCLIMKGELAHDLQGIDKQTRESLNKIYNPFCNVSLLDYDNFTGHEQEMLFFLFSLSRYGFAQNAGSTRVFDGLLFNAESIIPQYLRSAAHNHLYRNYHVSFLPMYYERSNCRFSRVIVLHYGQNPQIDIPVIDHGIFLDITNPSYLQHIRNDHLFDSFLDVLITIHPDVASRRGIEFLGQLMPRLVASLRNFTTGEKSPNLEGFQQRRVPQGADQQTRDPIVRDNTRASNTKQASYVNFLFYYILTHWVYRYR
tara:strand:+ start:6117 stop:8354 length:2238 start_codon:yes stop_codon:yes gene_type:complete